MCSSLGKCFAALSTWTTLFPASFTDLWAYAFLGHQVVSTFGSDLLTICSVKFLRDTYSSQYWLRSINVNQKCYQVCYRSLEEYLFNNELSRNFITPFIFIDMILNFHLHFFSVTVIDLPKGKGHTSLVFRFQLSLKEVMSWKSTCTEAGIMSCGCSYLTWQTGTWWEWIGKILLHRIYLLKSRLRVLGTCLSHVTISSEFVLERGPCG